MSWSELFGEIAKVGSVHGPAAEPTVNRAHTNFPEYGQLWALLARQNGFDFGEGLWEFWSIERIMKQNEEGRPAERIAFCDTYFESEIYYLVPNGKVVRIEPGGEIVIVGGDLGSFVRRALNESSIIHLGGLEAEATPRTGEKARYRGEQE